MSYYDVVIQPDGRPALVLRIEPPRPPEGIKEEGTSERGVVIINPYEEPERETIILEM
tara:strand:+ start:1330 stop:1503 length:174 start_codon:yes stop_codon:yes gene_type:complete